MFPLMLVYMALTILRPQDYPAVDGLPLPLLPLLLILALLAFLFSTRKYWAAPQFPLLLAFMLAIMASSVANRWLGGAMVQLGEMGPVLLTCFLMANAITTLRRLRMTMAVLALCTVVLAIHGVLQSQSGIGWTGMPLVEDGRIQYVGIFSDPNDLGLLFIIALPMALYLSAQGGLLGLRRLFWLGAAAVMSYAIYLTNSRGAMLALAVLATVWLWQRRGVVVAGVFGIVGLSLMALLPSRLQQLDAEETSAAGRIDAWYAGWEMFTTQPLFGVGVGNFTDYNWLTAHNSFVLVLAETGFLGYTFWAAFVGYSFAMMYQLMQPQARNESIPLALQHELRRLGTTLFISLCGFFAAAFFLSRSYVITLYLLVGMAIALYRMSEQVLVLPRFSVFANTWRLPLYSLASIVALYVVIRVLLIGR